MRHGCALRKLSRSPAKRSRMLRSLATSLFTHERITTTIARGKELRRYADKLITLACRGGLFARSRIHSLLYTRSAADRLLGELATRYRNRPGGYTRVWRAGPRERDKVPLSVVELVDNPWDIRKTFAKFREQDQQFKARLKTLSYPRPYTPPIRPLLK